MASNLHEDSRQPFIFMPPLLTCLKVKTLVFIDTLPWTQYRTLSHHPIFGWRLDSLGFAGGGTSRSMISMNFSICTATTSPKFTVIALVLRLPSR